MNNKTSLKLDHMSLRVWLRLLGCTKLIENHIRGNLREDHNTTLPRFDVMAQLYRFPEGLRMGEISQLLMVSGGNITGIIDQLEKENLVERIIDPNDRRAYIARPTIAGLETFESMAVEHRGWIDELLDGLTKEEQQTLHTLLTKLRESLNEKLIEQNE
jgi:DNA-binding MarR family transcriptional regulator